MARIRTFKPELFTDEKLGDCSRDARLLFLGLLSHCDDLGRQQYSPASVKSKIFPYDEDLSPSMVDEMVRELAEVGVIELYTHGSNRQRWLRVPHFLDHQVINHPSHSWSPPSPTELDPIARLCRCQKSDCIKARKDAEDAQNGHHRSKRFPQERTESSVSATGVLPEYGSDTGILREHSSLKEGRKEGTIDIYSSGSTYIQDTADNQPQTPNPQESQTSVETRRARFAALTELATAILGLVAITPNPNILNILIKSIEVRARSKGLTPEAATQEIASRAVWLFGESPPEDWLSYFYDARYVYVPQGDARLKDVRTEARPVCGGTRCREGWETVKVGDKLVSRRCPDCARLWAEAGG